MTKLFVYCRPVLCLSLLQTVLSSAQQTTLSYAILHSHTNQVYWWTRSSVTNDRQGNQVWSSGGSEITLTTNDLSELRPKHTWKLDYLAVIVSRPGPGKICRDGIRDQFGLVIYEHYSEPLRERRGCVKARMQDGAQKSERGKSRKEKKCSSFLSLLALVSSSVFFFFCFAVLFCCAFSWETAVSQSLPFSWQIVVHQRLWRTILNLIEFCLSVC